MQNLAESAIRKTKAQKLPTILVLVIFVLSLFIPFYKTLAIGDLTAISDTLTRVQKTTAANHTIVFTTPTGIDEGDTVTLTFATGFNIASVVTGDVTIEGAAVTSAVPAGQVLTITAAAGNVVAPAGTADIVIGNNHITNPGTEASYKVDIAGTFNDVGSFAIAIVDDDTVQVTTTIDPYLTFKITTVAVILTAEVGAGNPSYTDTGVNEGDDNTLEAATNAGTGYNITYNGSTLSRTSGTPHDITAMAGGASVKNSEQFGINLKLNTTPATGTDPTGDGDGLPASGYGTANSFKFIEDTATTLASAGAATKSNVYTVTYIVNVAEDTAAGDYATTITYIATGNF